MSKKTGPEIFRFVSLLFLIFEKRDERKNWPRNFQIRKYDFLIFEKRDEQKS